MKDFVKKTPDETALKRKIHIEIGFQKQPHPVDARERSHLYRMNQITATEMVENIAILLDSEVDNNK